MANLDLLFNARNGITVGNSQFPIADNLGNVTPLTLSTAGNVTITNSSWLQFSAAPTLFSQSGTGFYLRAPDVSTTPLTIQGSGGATWGTWTSAGLSVSGYLMPTTISTGALGATTGAFSSNVTVSGTTTLSGVSTVSNTTASTSYTTGALLVAGGVGITGAVFTATNITAGGDITAFSDARLKTNVQTLQDSLKIVSQLRGVSFDKDGKRSIGVIAQEVQEVLPEVVQDGEYLSVAYGNIVGLLIEAIKELNAEIAVLKANR